MKFTAGPIWQGDCCPHAHPSAAQAAVCRWGGPAVYRTRDLPRRLDGTPYVPSGASIPSVPEEEHLIRYATVRSHGCYGQGETVYPARLSFTLESALKYAAHRTSRYRKVMPGYTTGGYRVIKIQLHAHADRPRWRGIDLDNTEDAQGEE